MISVFLLESPLPTLFLLFGTLFMTMLSASILRLGRIKSKEILQSSFFFFQPLLRRFFPRHEWDTLHVAIGQSKNIFQLLYTLSGFFYLTTSVPYFRELLSDAPSSHDWPPLILAASTLLSLWLICDFLSRLIASAWPRFTLKFCAPFSSFFLLLAFPLVSLLLHLTHGIVRKVQADEEAAEFMPTRAQIKELIRESELQHHLDPFDQKLISSFVNFRERVAKEIMVPRVDIFSLNTETSIREAGHMLSKQEYSRIPVYRDSLDQIVGVVLYKDLLKFYTDPPAGTITLDSPIESLAKPVIYAPENKKIAHLLQEFRNKQIHMAIIVDEYGGTEGIVTIEDILEELVGEIEDEYDIGEDQPYYALPDGSWVVDAKMNILDIEEQLSIRIPPHAEYETIGGYVFHCAGTIPAKGWRLMHDEFDLEVISSNERSVKKIKIIPHPHVQEA
ncbi:MAG: corC [Parachlamydiales bacterium]|nr:corC [Parachlamydiales bacterium]